MMRLTVATAMPLSSAAGKPCSCGDRRPPGDRRAVPADQRHRARDDARRLRQAERHRADGADRVLQEDEGDRHEAEHPEDATAGGQIRQPGIHPDRREEDDEQLVPRGHVEADVDAEEGMHRPEDAAPRRSRR